MGQAVEAMEMAAQLIFFRVKMAQISGFLPSFSFF
jgi:hypothetical protein